MDCATLGTCWGDDGAEKGTAITIGTKSSEDIPEVIEPLSENNNSKEGIFGVTVPTTSGGLKASSEGKKLQRGLSGLSGASSSSKGSKSSIGAIKARLSGVANIAARWARILEAKHVPEESGTVVLKDDERLIVFDQTCHQGSAVPCSLNDRGGGHPNRVRTTKFTPLTWLPKSLMYQFQRTANIYFLYISCLVIWPWSPKNWKSKIFPFAGVLLWTALKDLYEDIRRKRDDDNENGQTVWRVRHELGMESPVTFETVRWSDVKVGDVVIVQEDHAFPADLLLVHAAGDEEAFISTVMLDGETSLKNRMVPGFFEVIRKACSTQAPEEWKKVQKIDKEAYPTQDLLTQLTNFIGMMRSPGLEFKFPSPTPVLSDVRGSVQPAGNMEDALVCPYTEENFLPRGCILRNTSYIVGVAMYVGDDTKTRLNASTAKLKFSNMQVNLNFCVRGLLVALFSLCVVATLIAFAFQGSLSVDMDTLSKDDRNPLIKFFMFNVTFYHVVPMSLYVVYEMLKLVLAFQVNADKQMYDPVRDEMAKARTAEVMEEMGQVNFLFSDKTGTLTANEMVFARCHIAGKDMGEFRPSDDTPGEGMTQVRKLLEAGEKEDESFGAVLKFFTVLAVCHSVQVLEKPAEGGNPATFSFNGMSPDEVALVEAAKAVGITFVRRTRNNNGSTEVLIRGPGTVERKFTILFELAFNSDRKRMSVVVRHKNVVYCITKGADSVMEGLLATGKFGEDCARDLSIFSRQGLRTLVLGMREIPKEEFEAWNTEYVKACNLIDDTKEAKMGEVGARLEKDFQFVGVTAVEDRLQDGVPDAISRIKEMGIRLWVLTGDKTETAVDIARSCKLFTDTTFMSYAVQAESAEDAEAKLLLSHKELSEKEDTGLVLDGQTLIHAMSNEECRKIIYDLGVVSRSCICARLSPMQKLELVQLVREQNPKSITLAVGDGANDVPMIQGAHVGVAIRGKEGTQAVQASDVAICYFRFLVPLLLCHGRRAYRRIAMFLNFYLYKNVALLMCDIIWMFQDKFRSRIAFPEYLSVGFNVLYSAWHLVFLLGFDFDVSDAVAVASPSLYFVGPERQLFNAKLFARWLAVGVLQGSIAWSIPFAMVGTLEYNKQEPGQFWISSTAAFTAINLIVCFKLVMYAQKATALSCWAPTAIALFSYFIALLTLSYTPIGRDFQPSMWQIPGELASQSDAILSIFIATIVALSFDAVGLLVAYFVWPSELQLVKRAQRGKRSEG